VKSAGPFPLHAHEWYRWVATGRRAIQIGRTRVVQAVDLRITSGCKSSPIQISAYDVLVFIGVC